MLVSNESYTAITGDSTSDSDAITAALAEAQREVEAYLRHPIECAERTEALRAFPPFGRVYPNATPIIAVSDPSITQVEGYSLIASNNFFFLGNVFLSLGVDPYDHYLRIAVTYVGGWIGDDDYTALLPLGFDTGPALLPSKVRRAIAYLARENLVPTVNPSEAGAIMVQLGDARIQYKNALSLDNTRHDILATLKGLRRSIGSMRQ